MNRSDIINILSLHRQELEERFGVTKIGLFGSYARGEEKQDSDIDIAVEIESKNKFRSFFRLKHFLEQTLNANVDLGIESTLKPVAKQYVLKEIIYV
ncbi:MAG: nucleotidyltransferase family protein [Pseudomonadota bacterium]